MSYSLDIWGGERRTIESLQAQEDSQRFMVEAAYITLTTNIVIAAIQEASLRGQIDATNQLIGINSKMLELLRRQFMEGYANRNDVALQEAQLAQTRTTLPPLRKALAQQRNLLAALGGRLPADEPKETFNLATLTLPTELAGEPAVAARPAASRRARPPRSSCIRRAPRSASPPPTCCRTSRSTPSAVISSPSSPACSPRRTRFG